MSEKKINSKQKGNTFERKIAKELSQWMFNNKDILRRHPTSGCEKCIWTGDVVPLAQMPDEWNNTWSIHIECKTGYKDDTPDFWNYKKIITWFNKAKLESEINNQYIIYLICQFKHRSALLITNTMLPHIKYNLVILNDDLLYVYIYNDVINSDFNIIFENQIKIK